MTKSHFTSDSMRFLYNIAKNNDRDWFAENKAVYEDVVRTPVLRFIADIADELAIISPHFLVSSRKVGGSLKCIFRDVRLAKDKHPYKTNIGIQFRHEQGKDMHAPCFYVHIEPDNCFNGVGIWLPNSEALCKIRDRICDCSKKWQVAINEPKFKKHFELRSDILKNGPRGYANDHPLIHNLKRKDFIAISNNKDETVLKSGFKKLVLECCHAVENYMLFLCQALELRY